MDKSLYYDPNKLFSFNRILNFVIGARGIGKSYGFKKFCIKRFKKNGAQFIYVRRYKTELKKIGQFFDDVKKEFPDDKFEVKGRQFFINGELAGWAIPLSIWQSEKSNAYPNVENIFFDEFIREKDKSDYLPNEVDAFLNLMDTVFRDRPNVRAFCASNAVTIVNPYFLYFGLIPNKERRYNAYQSIVVEIPDSTDFSNERRKTPFGSLIDGTAYGDMSLDNEFVNDSDVFIKKRSKESKFQFSVEYEGITMGVWVDVEEMLMYLSPDHDPDTKMKFAMTTNDLNESNMLLNNWKQNYYLGKMVKAFKNGQLRFDNQTMRNIGYEMFKKMRVQ